MWNHQKNKKKKLTETNSKSDLNPEQSDYWYHPHLHHCACDMSNRASLPGLQCLLLQTVQLQTGPLGLTHTPTTLTSVSSLP